jgi:hypothetical protein|tara:strand:- start:423 stop:800 length:378 start_codon:yes stop_codon:yes gene_type:complete
MATPIKNKYFILRTRQRTSISGDGGEYLLAIDNIQTILGGDYISVVYAGGLVVKLMFSNLDGTVVNLDPHKEGVISYMTNSALRLLESPNVSFKIPYKFPGAVSTAGEQMYINQVQICLFTTACV